MEWQKKLIKDRIMYRLLNKLFGWDYVYEAAYHSRGIYRVFVFPDGTVGYWAYQTMTHRLVIIRKPDDVTWLTCKPSKYLGK